MMGTLTLEAFVIFNLPDIRSGFNFLRNLTEVQGHFYATIYFSFVISKMRKMVVNF